MNSDNIRKMLIALLQIRDTMKIHDDYGHSYFDLLNKWSVFNKTESSTIIASENYALSGIYEIPNDEIFLDKDNKLYVNFKSILFNISIGDRNEQK